MYSNLDNEDEILDSCLICFENFTLNHKIACLPCGHIFGNQCIQDWLNSSSACPVCNRNSTKDDIRLIFGKTILITESEQLAKKELAIANQSLSVQADEIEELKFQLAIKESDNMQLKKDLDEERTMRMVFEQQLSQNDKSMVDKNEFNKIVKELEEERSLRVVFEMQLDEWKSIVDDRELIRTKEELKQIQEISKTYENQIYELKLELAAKELENMNLFLINNQDKKIDKDDLNDNSNSISNENSNGHLKENSKDIQIDDKKYEEILKEEKSQVDDAKIDKKNDDDQLKDEDVRSIDKALIFF